MAQGDRGHRKGFGMKLFGPRYPEEIAARIPPGQRLVKGWPVLHFGAIPRFDEAEWTLQVSGLVENPYPLSYSRLKTLGPVTVQADMHCVTGWTTLDNAWEGVPFRVLAERAEPKQEAGWVIAHCERGYTSNLSLQAMLDDDVLVAWGHNGEPLAPEHGFPLRLVVPKRYAWKSAKWLRGLEFSNRNERGFWEVRGYHTHADPWREERYSYQETKESEGEP
jgi:DMSO/TMAO reductase YedYZ molybdopterin-dependent catalytic subunit